MLYGILPMRSVTLAAPKHAPISHTTRWCETASTMAGSPGSNSRTSAPSPISAWGKAPSTSASPPVLTSGKISAPTCRTLQPAVMD